MIQDADILCSLSQLSLWLLNSKGLEKQVPRQNSFQDLVARRQTARERQDQGQAGLQPGDGSEVSSLPNRQEAPVQSPIRL